MRRLKRNRSGRNARYEALQQQLILCSVDDRVGIVVGYMAPQGLRINPRTQGSCQKLCKGSSIKRINCALSSPPVMFFLRVYIFMCASVLHISVKASSLCTHNILLYRFMFLLLQFINHWKDFFFVGLDYLDFIFIISFVFSTHISSVC